MLISLMISQDALGPFSWKIVHGYFIPFRPFAQR